MKKEILKALKSVIEHWENNVAGIENSWAGIDCKLCVLVQGSKFSCYIGEEQCPVYKKTGTQHCWRTPWEEIKDHVRGTHSAAILVERKFLPGCPECDRLKLKELEFLKSLLSKPKK